jgi:predicted nucleotidyltransferase
MSRKRATHSTPQQDRWYRGTDVPMTVIRKFARDVAERFQPEKIILFGSHAYGKPHADSDVDILVVMPARNQIDQAAKIHTTLPPEFPLDLIVRTPHNMQWRLAEGDSFLREILTKGKVLYEKGDARVGAQGRKRHSTRAADRQRKRTVS